MDIKEVNIISKDGQVAIHHIQGKLPEPLPLLPKKVYTFTGTIDAPLAYFKGKARYLSVDNVDKAIVHYDQGGAITFVEDPNDKESDVVDGKLIINPVFERIGINEIDVNYDVDGLRKIVRENAALFSSKGEYKRVLGAIQDVKLRVDSEYANQKTSTSSAKSAAHRLSEEFNLRFEIKAPIHIGSGETLIPIDLLVDVSSNPRFYFESVDLVFMEASHREEILKQNIAEFTACGVTVLQQN